MAKKKSKAHLSLNMICGDFEPVETIERALASVLPYVDDAYIAITYKDKKPTTNHPLVKLLTKNKVNVLYYEWSYNFAEARQFVLEATPKGENNFVIWIDADDVFANGSKIAQIVEDMIHDHIDGVYFPYWYQVALDESGNVKEILVEHKRERIIRNNDIWMWVGDLHETLIEQRYENTIKIFRDECHVIHLTNPKRLDLNIDRNIEILEASYHKEGERKDPRTLMYLAKAYFDKGKMLEGDDRKAYTNGALKLFHQYLNGSGEIGKAGYQEASGWAEERSTAWEYVGEIALLHGEPKVAIQAFQSAIDECPYFPNYYIDLAVAYVALNDFKQARHWLNVGTSIPEPKTTIVVYPRNLKLRVLEASFQCNLHDQKMDWALKDAEMLLEILPEDKLAQERVQTVKEIIEYNRACQSIVFLGKYLEAVGQKEKIPNLIQAIPSAMEVEKFASEMKHIYMPAKRWAPNEIAILCGPGFEPWDPDRIKDGIGGSEEAVIYLSQELNKLGWKVTVYGDPRKPGDFDGVEYRPWREINRNDVFNVLILWRSIGFIDVKPKAKVTMLWLHDVPNNPEFIEERVDRIDKVAVLSEFHKSLLRLSKGGMFEKFPENKVFLTSNGLPTFEAKQWKGNPKKLIYASSFDRGLIYLLRMWPDIKKEVPQAELHIYYGWELYDFIHRGNPARAKWKESVVKLMEQDGIVYHGRVGHEELNKAYAQSGIWAYPTDFEEISCISAMRAQKMGAVPVVTNYAALEETVKNGVRVDVDITTEEGQKEYLKALVDLLKDEKKQQEIREQMMKFAATYYDWENVAKIWAQNFKDWVIQADAKRFIAEPEATEKSGDTTKS